MVIGVAQGRGRRAPDACRRWVADHDSHAAGPPRQPALAVAPPV